MDEPPPRILALWCPDWPVVAAAAAAGVGRHRPAAVVAVNRVLACSAVARAQGVRRGLRRREAQARCPELVVLAADAERDARLFEQVAVAVEELAPGVEVVRPGLVALLAQGPVGYFGGTRQVAERLIDHVAARTGVECQIGIADGLFAATLAAHRGLLVEPGRVEEFLAPLPVDELDREPGVDRAELIDLLRRLGLRSLGAFARLPASDVASRFGADAVLAHRLSRGLDPRPPARRRPPEELAVALELDPPVTRVDAAAFASRTLAERLHTLLAGHGLACTRLGIQARTLDGVELSRIWRCAEPLTPAGTVDRVRWQLEAWLTRELIRRGEQVGETGAEAGGIGLLRLSGEEVVTAGALQLGLWGDVGAADERAGRALVRVQALLGPEGVFTAVLGGGRDPAERARLVPWGDERPASGAELAMGPGVGLEVPSAGGSASVASMLRAGGAGAPEVPPWPGRLPAPSPTTVLARPVPIELWDSSGNPVHVTDRYLLTSVPALAAVDGARPVPVHGWAGPWPLDQRWWDTTAGWRGSRLQVLLGGSSGLGAGVAVDRAAGHAADRSADYADHAAGHGGAGVAESVESALLLFCRDGRWSVAGVYG
ncbi:MAG TPA: DNA polymerase Y family protein [Pseudonocardia sp.]|nr:DNA polymerase Y family protein [Pseudonocardia sp.]